MFYKHLPNAAAFQLFGCEFMVHDIVPNHADQCDQTIGNQKEQGVDRVDHQTHEEYGQGRHCAAKQISPCVVYAGNLCIHEMHDKNGNVVVHQRFADVGKAVQRQEPVCAAQGLEEADAKQDAADQTCFCGFQILG